MIPAAKRQEVSAEAIPAENAEPIAPGTLPEEVTNLSGNQRYVACAFYTSNYLSKVLRLKASLDRFGINYHLKCLPRRMTWEATTRLKAQFLNDCLTKFPDHDVLYLDADAIIRNEPKFFETVTSDVTLLFTPVRRDGKRALTIAAGTLYVRNTAGGRRFAETWQSQEPKVGPLGLDEDMIYSAFNEFEGISFTALPRAYSKIFDANGPEPVIEHFQASREQLKFGKLVRRSRRALHIAIILGGLFLLITLLSRLFS